MRNGTKVCETTLKVVPDNLLFCNGGFFVPRLPFRWPNNSPALRSLVQYLSLMSLHIQNLVMFILFSLFDSIFDFFVVVLISFYKWQFYVQSYLANEYLTKCICVSMYVLYIYVKYDNTAKEKFNENFHYLPEIKKNSYKTKTNLNLWVTDLFSNSSLIITNYLLFWSVIIERNHSF